MFGSEKRVLAKHYLDRGLSQTAVAEMLGIIRRTVSRWIQQGAVDVPVAEPRYNPRPLAVTKLERYKPLIEVRLAAYPELSAVRLFQEARGGRLHRRLHATARIREGGAA